MSFEKIIILIVLFILVVIFISINYLGIKNKHDLKLIGNYLLNRKIKMIYPRDINSIDYWKNCEQLMLDSYNHKNLEQLRLEKLRDEILFNYIKIIKPKHLLEVGCGFGYTLKKIAQKFPNIEIYGCDFAENLVFLSHKYLNGIVHIENLKKASAYDLSIFNNKFFDLILTSGCLMCLKADQVFLALNEFKKYSDKFLFIEPDYTKMSLMEKLRFKEERNYPINNYDTLISNSRLKIISKNNNLYKYDFMTYYLCKKI